MESLGKYVLGIDIGTSSIKTIILEVDSKTIVAKQSEETQANVPSDLAINGNEQDVRKILSAINICVSSLPINLLKQVKSIGICGQMHGIVLWNPKNQADERNCALELDINEDNVSHLYTWQDSRCNNDFLKKLPTSMSHLPVHKGYGCATLFWFTAEKHEILEKFRKCGTIQDLVVSLLTGTDEVTMSIQNAASWGYFLTEECRWEIEKISDTGFPIHLIPKKILKPGEVAGKLAKTWFGIPSGVPIGVALGDLQCSVLASLMKSDEGILNISTSAQLTYVHPTFKPQKDARLEKIEYFPYFNGQYLAVAASLNGGNTLATFVKTLQQWVENLGFSVPQSEIWKKLMELSQNQSAISKMKIEPLLFGDRYFSDKLTSITGITLDTLQLGSVFRALCSGIIANLHSMMPGSSLEESGIKCILGNGSALTRNVVLQEEFAHWYHLPLEIRHSGDAAYGAALAAINIYK